MAGLATLAVVVVASNLVFSKPLSHNIGFVVGAAAGVVVYEIVKWRLRQNADWFAGDIDEVGLN